MSKKKHKHRSEPRVIDEEPQAKLSRKAYERELARLQGELVHLQQWVVATGAKVCVVFEGRDTAERAG